MKKLLSFRLLVLVVLLSLIYASTFRDLWLVWNRDPNYGHGVFVPFLAFFILWWRKDQILKIEPKPHAAGLAVFLFGLCLYLIGIAGNEDFTTRTSFIVVLLGILLTLWGKEGTKAVSFPLFYLVLMIPLPYIVYYAVASPMKLFATKWAVYVIDLLHITIHHEGNIIYLPNTTLEVANACSGLRSLMSLFTFGVAFAYLVQKTLLFRVLLAVSIFPIAILSNILRIIVTVLLAVYKGPATAHGFLHGTSGVIVYTTATFLIFGVNEFLRKIIQTTGHQRAAKT
jgi:exosortase